jgi:transposase
MSRSTDLAICAWDQQVPASNGVWASPILNGRIWVVFRLAALSRLKHFRRVATRYDKLADNFFAMIRLACMRLWLRAYESTT